MSKTPPVSQFDEAPQGHLIGKWRGKHIYYALTRSLTGKRHVWARFGTLGWERLGELVDTPGGHELKRDDAWEGHPLPDLEWEIVNWAAASDDR